MLLMFPGLHMMWSFLIIIIAYLICGCLIESVESQTRVITRHNLPQNRLMVVFGSQNNGSCTYVSQSLNGSPVCAGTSVLNDGIIPALDGVSSNTAWATEFFTLRGIHGGLTRLSFELDSVNHDRMELAVLNCPEKGINISSFSVYFDESFRLDRDSINQTLGTFIVESQLVVTSCDQILVFCVKYNATQPPTRFINLVIPNRNLDYIFLGEVTFLNGGNEPCDLDMPIQGPVIQVTSDSQTDHDSLSTSATHDQPTECQDQCDSRMATALTTGVISIIITALLVAGISVVIQIAVYHCVYKPRLTSAFCHKPGSGGGDAIVYDVVDERVGGLELKQNEAYGVAKSRGNN